MPRKPSDQRRAELAAIHVAKKKLGLDDDTYRDLLYEWTGKDSSARMTPKQRQRVIENFRKMGFEKKSGEVDVQPDDAPQVQKIKSLWRQLHRVGAVRNPHEKALNAYVKRMTDIQHVRWLPPKKANTVIEALKAWKERFTDTLHDRNTSA